MSHWMPPVPDRQNHTGILMSKDSLCFTVAEGILQINGKTVATELPVAQAIPCGDVLVVRLNAPNVVPPLQNVLAFSRDGICQWKIEEGMKGSPGHYVSLSLDESNRLIAENFSGITYLVNVLDGSVSDIAFRRF